MYRLLNKIKKIQNMPNIQSEDCIELAHHRHRLGAWKVSSKALIDRKSFRCSSSCKTHRKS